MKLETRNGGRLRTAAACGLLVVGCRAGGLAEADPTAAEATELFVDRAVASGIDFTYRNGMSGKLYMVEMVGGGAALFDYDNDGDLDLFLVQGGRLGGEGDGTRTPSDRLFRNDLVPGAGDFPRFTDVTAGAGLVPGASADYGQGVAAGDVDNDGFIDLYVTNYGPNRLWRNNGDGTFSDRSAVSGTQAGGWSTSVTFADLDGDGFLDLFVARYLDATLDNHFQCTSATGLVDYCGPLSFEPLSDRLYRNLGDGRFSDISESSGIAERPGAALGVVSADFNGDRHADLFVANDQMENFLWLNQGDGSFLEQGVLAGCAVNAAGRPEASMGVDAADFDGDGDLDLFLTHLQNESNTLYLNDGRGLFVDATAGSGLGPMSLPFTSFGTRSLDYDSDGWLDLLVVSGTVRRIEEQLQAGVALPLAQSNQLFRGLGGGRFEESTELAGAAFNRLHVSRGAAFGDLDNDGDIDVVVVNNSGPLELLENRAGDRQRWLGLRLVAGEPPRDQYGALAALELAGGRTLWRRAAADGSFLSAHDPRVLFGLPAGESVRELRVTWPDRRRESWSELAIGRYTTLRQGSGRTLAEGSR